MTSEVISAGCHAADSPLRGAADKRRLEFEGGHVNLMIRVDVIREILQWIDSRLGRQTQR